jgi:hypothetical protein
MSRFGGSVLFDQLQIAGDANSIDEHLALVDERLIGDLGIGELPSEIPRQHKLNCFGSFLCAGSCGKEIADRKIVEVKSCAP